MKKMSLKWKITLWYAGILILLVTLLFGFLLSTSGRLLRSESVLALKDAVWDFAGEIEVDREHESWELDEDIRFYEKGVLFSLYDGQGHLLAGGVPDTFPKGTTLKAYATQKIKGSAKEWTVYDVAVPYGGEKFLWARGVYEDETLTAIERAMLRMLLVACPILIAVALLVGYWITRGALLPIKELCKTAETIGEGKDLSLRIPVGHTQGELRQLADTFNHMFARLERAFERERQFTSDASHELRTPVSVILSQAEYALLPDSEPGERIEGLEIILKQAEGMSRLLSRLLLLARSDSAGEQPAKEKFDISALALEVFKEMNNRTQKCQTELAADICPGLFIYGDRESTARVFYNLLENAVQYGKENGRITLRVFPEQGIVNCQVEDNGIGIGPEHLDKIWNRFYRADTAHGSGNGNSGLGLAIVKTIVERQGGTAEVRSRPGEGSCFTIRLPKADSAP